MIPRDVIGGYFNCGRAGGISLKEGADATRSYDSNTRREGRASVGSIRLVQLLLVEGADTARDVSSKVGLPQDESLLAVSGP
jgi:hypothetical protein